MTNLRLLIDANILLDVLQRREPHFAHSVLIWKLCEAGRAEGYVSTLSVANLVYVMRRELDPERVRDVLEKLALVFHFTDLTASDIARAAERRWPDFEDALQSVTAERIHADCIVTRNVRDFKDSQVVALAPPEILARL